MGIIVVVLLCNIVILISQIFLIYEYKETDAKLDRIIRMLDETSQEE